MKKEIEFPLWPTVLEGMGNNTCVLKERAASHVRLCKSLCSTHSIDLIYSQGAPGARGDAPRQTSLYFTTADEALLPEVVRVFVTVIMLFV